MPRPRTRRFCSQNPESADLTPEVQPDIESPIQSEDTTSEPDTNCRICKLNVSDEDSAVGCDGCDTWFHYACLNLESSVVDRIKNYFCDSCEGIGMVTEWYLWAVKPASVKRRHYYEVERIHKWAVHGTTRFFLIEWKNCPVGASRRNSRSWEPEKHLDGCLDLLQNYLRRNKLPLSDIEGLMGSTNSSHAQKSNWHSMRSILDKFSKLRARLSLDHIDIKTGNFNGLKEYDGLYFLEHDFHCFVMLHIKADNKVYVADGGNILREEPDTRAHLESLVNKARIVSCKLLKSTREDHCASSAVFIAIEFLRAYQAGRKPLLITLSNYLYMRETKSMHSEPSAMAQKLPLHLRRQNLKCTTCGRGFMRNARKALANHIRACRI